MTVSLDAAAWASTDGGAAWLPVEEDAPPALRVFGREGGEEGVNFSPKHLIPSQLLRSTGIASYHDHQAY